VHDGAHDQALFARLQGAHAVGKGFGKHGNGAIDEVNGIAAEARFAVERGFGKNVVGDVGDVNLQEPAAIFAALDIDGVVEIASGLTVDGDDGERAEILASGDVGGGDRNGEMFGFGGDVLWEDVREMMLTNDDFGVDTEFSGTSEDFDDAAGGWSAAAGVAKQFNVDDGAIEFGDVWQSFAARGEFFCGGQKLLAKGGRKFVAGSELDFVLDARIVGMDNDAA
jgi:hypothetical protein